MKRRRMGKFYSLYNNKNQEVLLTTADSEEKLKEETEYYSDGVWFSYDTKENSNIIENEKEVKGIKFPETPKKRNTSEEKVITVKNFKWLS